MRFHDTDRNRELFGGGRNDRCPRCEAGSGSLCEACQQELKDESHVPDHVAPLCDRCEAAEAHLDTPGDLDLCDDCADHLRDTFAGSMARIDDPDDWGLVPVESAEVAHCELEILIEETVDEDPDPLTDDVFQTRDVLSAALTVAATHRSEDSR
jgi:hypothetical protein